MFWVRHVQSSNLSELDCRTRREFPRKSETCLDPCFTAFHSYTEKSRDRRRLDSSKLPRDASSWNRRTESRIRLQAPRTSAHSGLFVYGGFAVALAVSHSPPCTTWTILSMPARTDI